MVEAICSNHDKVYLFGGVHGTDDDVNWDKTEQGDYQYKRELRLRKDNDTWHLSIMDFHEIVNNLKAKYPEKKIKFVQIFVSRD